MEFTLAQLTPDNLKSLFEAGYFEVVDVTPPVYEDDGDVKYWGSVLIKEDGNYYKIMPAVDAEFIQFSFNLFLPADDMPPAEIMLKVSNYYDIYPVHMHFVEVDSDGDIGIKMIYTQIFPDGEQIEAKKFIKLFKSFVNLTKKNMSKFPKVTKLMNKENG